MAINKTRTSAIALGLSAAMFASFLQMEGYEEVAKPPVKNDYCTYGFGTIHNPDGSYIKCGAKTDPVRAVILAVNDSKKYEVALHKCMGEIPLFQREFDAYASLAYNVGPGAVCRSSILPKLKAGQYEEACKTILSFDKFQGKPLRGLTLRREKEYKICIGEIDPLGNPIKQEPKK